MATYTLETPFRWTLTDGGSLNFSFEVIGGPNDLQWVYPQEARKVLPPGGGPPTLLVNTLALQPRQFRVRVRINPGSDRDSRCTTLRSAWAGLGPYTLSGPFFSNMHVVCDPSQGALEERPGVAGAREFLVAFQEQS